MYMFGLHDGTPTTVATLGELVTSVSACAVVCSELAFVGWETIMVVFAVEVGRGTVVQAKGVDV